MGLPAGAPAAGAEGAGGALGIWPAACTLDASPIVPWNKPRVCSVATDCQILKGALGLSQSG